MNTVQLIGNISTDIDTRFTPSGKCVAIFNLAVTNPYNRDKTVFLPIEVWGKVAENTSNFCSKGSKIGVVGHIDIDTWEKDGQKRSKTKIVASQVEFLTPKGKSTSNENQANTEQNKPLDDDPFADMGTPIDFLDNLPF
jgi:single-strand DNA-binding protein